MPESISNPTDATERGPGAEAGRSKAPMAAGTGAGGPRIAEAGAAGQAGDVTIVPAPQAGERVVIAVRPGETLRLAFDPAAAAGAEVGGDAVLTFPGGGEVVLQHFAEAALSGNPPDLTTADGTVIDLAEFLVALGVPPEGIEAATAPAAGEPDGPPPGAPNQGASFTPGEAPQILGSLDPAGPLDGTALRYRVPDVEGRLRFVPVEEGGEGPQPPADGRPDAADDAARVFSGHHKEFKLVYVIDVSDSMNDVLADSGGKTRLDAAKGAFNALNSQAIAAGLGGAEVLIVTFNHRVQQVREFARADDASIDDFIDALTASGSTDYESALDVATDWLDGRPITTGVDVGPTSEAVRHGADTDSRIFFLTDGGNNNGVGGFDPDINDIQDLYANIGEATRHLTNVTVKSVGFGITEGDTAVYNALDQSDDNLLNGSAEAVPDIAGVEGIRAGFGTVESENVATGNLLANDGSADGVKTVVSITVDGTTYLAADGNLADLATTLGGKFSFDFETGAYTYEAPTSISFSGTEAFSYTIEDGDGDRSSASLTIEIDPGLLPNGGFELGNLLDWSAAGSVWVSDETGPAPEGEFLALLHTNHPVNAASGSAPLTPLTDYESYSDTEIEGFLDLGAGTLDALVADANTMQGAALKAGVTVDPGAAGTISFDWNFLTNQAGIDDSAGDHNDLAFVVIEGEVRLLANADNENTEDGDAPEANVLDIADVLVADQSFSHGTDGWQSTTFSFADTDNDGEIEIAFGVLDSRTGNPAADLSQNSALLVDDVQVTVNNPVG